MSFTEEDVSRLYRVRKTVMQMLGDRGYDVADFEINMSRDEFKTNYTKWEDLVISKAKKGESGPPSDRIYVFFSDEPKIGIKSLKTYSSRMVSDNVFSAIIVAQIGTTPPVKTCISNVLAQKFRIEVFLEAELLVNITEHELVPKHRVLTETEKKSLLDRYTVKDTQLPRILINSDPVAKYYGLKRGQVVKISRLSETAGNYVTYRLAA